MKTLADFLGVQTPPPGEEAPRLEDINDPREFAKALINSYEFRRYIVNSLVLGELPSAVLLRVFDLAGWQKPPDRLEVKDVTPAEGLTADQLEARAERLTEMARFLRRAEQFDEPLSSDSIH